MRGVVVRLVEQPALRVARLRGDGGGEIVPQRVEHIRGMAEKGVVALAVKGVDIFNVEVYPVVLFLAQGGENIVKDAVLHCLIREHHVGNIAGEAARRADVRHGHHGGGVRGVGGEYERAVVDGDERAVRGHAVRKRAEEREIRQRGVEHGGGDVGIGVAVDLRRAERALGVPGDDERGAHREARGVGELIDGGEAREVDRVFLRDGIERVARTDGVYFHKNSPFTAI